MEVKVNLNRPLIRMVEHCPFMYGNAGAHKCHLLGDRRCPPKPPPHDIGAVYAYYKHPAIVDCPLRKGPVTVIGVYDEE